MIDLRKLDLVSEDWNSGYPVRDLWQESINETSNQERALHRFATKLSEFIEQEEWQAEMDDAFERGKEIGEETSAETEYDEGYAVGYNEGYDTGYTEGCDLGYPDTINKLDEDKLEFLREKKSS